MNSFTRALAALAVSVPMLACAQDYPRKVVRIIVPYPPGGTVDVVARLTAARLSENLGQQFIVDNRPGANGTIGSAAVAKSPPDGYTLLVQASTFVATALLMDKLPYDISKDFTPITNLGAVPLVVTCFPGIPAKDLREFVSAIRAQPNKYVFGTSAVGSASHLAQAAIRFQAKLDFTIIPYKGTAPALADVMGGHISAMVDALPSNMPHVNSGKLRPLAVRSARRIPSLPNVPTVAESGWRDSRWSRGMACGDRPTCRVSWLRRFSGRLQELSSLNRCPRFSVSTGSSFPVRRPRISVNTFGRN